MRAYKRSYESSLAREEILDSYEAELAPLEIGEVGFGWAHASDFSEEAVAAINRDYSRTASRVMDFPTDLEFVMAVHDPIVFEYRRSHVLFHDASEWAGDGAVVASHFAAYSDREGRDMIEALASLSRPIVFAVTERIAHMLSRLGFHDTGRRVPQFWRGEIHEKWILVNPACGL